MEIAMSMTGSAIDCYEDMFKEITKKLYGEDGLPDISNNEKAGCTTQQRIVAMEYESESENPILKPDEHLTAFGLAALMQNGFPTGGILNTGFQCHKSSPGILLGSVLEDKWISSEDNLPWTQSKIAMYNPSQKLFRCSECDCVGYLLRVAEHWLGTHSNLRAFHCPQCHYESAWARCVRIHLHRQHNINTDDSCDSLIKDNPVLQEVMKHLQKLKNKVEGNKSNSTNDSYSQNQPNVNNTSNSNVTQSPTNSDLSNITSKRYRCTYCPYATDRRDLFTRHENIHREEKPFQCYVCQKQFNRADHVKKHFLRMHRDDPYDLNRIRRHPPKNASGMSYYQKYHTGPAVGNSNDLATLGALSIPGLPRSLPPNARMQQDMKSIAKSSSSSLSNGLGKSSKKKGEKRFSCCYCSWSGVDNWCLKRHMNTHLKPFVCALCDYKAARSERLATHVLKVHNKRSCGKCNFLADDLTQLSIHQLEQHPLEQRSRPSNSNNVLRTNSFNGGSTISSAPTSGYPPSSSLTACSQGQNNGIFSTAAAAAAALLQNSSHQFLQASDMKGWNKDMPKAHGAARLFNYMEASDGEASDPESEPQQLEARPSLTQKLQSDFLEAGDVDKTDEDIGEETELPLFVCPMCGCEFEDDASLETHQYTHSRGTTSPATQEESKENVDPDFKYKCRVCDTQFCTQRAIMSHMNQHSSLLSKPVITPQPVQKKKQIRPKKDLPFWDLDEVEVLKHLNGKLKKWKCSLVTASRGNRKLVNKYIAQMVSRRGFSCTCCKNNGINKYHTRTCLALHQYLRQTKKRFKCEHCDLYFRHRYQIILHTSRVHKKNHTQEESSNESQRQSENNNTQSASNTEPGSSFATNSQSIYVPEVISSAHKLVGMSFFDHPFPHSSNASSTVNNHMPIIIPTFPPN
ncbi:unnamed protein product [Acanthoscelides obtectus]|uniref:C2H2-type domain-containing protein n=1 Tax=Acanthoscelides obtectus TaxID=200917 RepID=A0A9P0LU53_ACAOB|nr:unnamed protein product [Acanthoscelides obtectus]CAK1627651.1 Protein charlatan [Acanthoscelides obtectus]